MTWYKTGTVQVTSGSNAVVGTGTAFIANARVGDAFSGPDGNWYEVVNIVSNTSLGIYPNYRGASVASGGVYVIAPMEGYVKDSADALRAASLVIGQVGTDVTAQVQAAAASATAAKASEDNALVSKNSATASATTANSAVSTTLGYRNEAEGFKNTASTSASSATTAKNNAQTSETNAANSAAAAATSASQAATAVSGKANKGANTDITSLGGLTTALSVLQGGTGGTTAATARTNLGIIAVADVNDTTAGRFVTPGWMGIGSITAPQLISTFAEHYPAGFYRCVGGITTNFPIVTTSGGAVIVSRYSANNTLFKVTLPSLSRYFEGLYNGTSVVWTEVGGAGAISSYYESAATTWVANSDLVFTHNLGQPKLVDFEAVLTAAIGSYPIESRVKVPFYTSSAAYWGAQVIGMTPTTITIRCSNQMGLLQTSTVALVMTPSNSQILARVFV